MPKPPRNRAFLPLFGGVAALLLLTGGYLWSLGGTNPAVSRAIGGPFELTASTGQVVTDRSFRGRYMLIYFGYTGCRDVCPATLAAIGPALQALGPQAGRVQPLFITVDPQHDTPEVLRRYVANFTPRLLGLTGTAQALRQVRQDYQVEASLHPGPAAEIDHSSVLLLVAPDGVYVGPIAADATSAQMAVAIAAHMREEGQGSALDPVSELGCVRS